MRIVNIICAVLVGTMIATSALGRETFAGPVPFAAAHLAYARIVANESGMSSESDADGILQAMLYPRNKAGKGLSTVKLMRRMVAHSPRTFPENDLYLPLGVAYVRSVQNRWTSTLNLQCDEPVLWPMSTAAWNTVYKKNCIALMKLTRQYMLGKKPTRCTGQPTTWGNEADSRRRGGPIDRGWTEIFCDQDQSGSCKNSNRASMMLSPLCSQNRFWSWVR